MEGLLKKIKAYSIKNNNNRILKNYYSKEMRKGKTYRASFVDKFFIFIFLFIFLTIILTVKSGYLILSIYVSGIILFLLFNCFKGISKQKKKDKIKEINEKLKRKKLIREFSNLNKEGFTNYIKVLLEDYYKMKVKKGNPPIDLEATIGKEKYGVKCIKISMEDKVTLKDLEVFIRDLYNRGLDEGILVTNSFFREDVKEESKIILYDFENIIEILIKLNRYSTDDDVENYIIHRFWDKRNNIKEQIRIINKKKIFQFYGMFIIFYSLSYFINYSRYYKIMAIICFVIASIVSGYKISEYIILKDKYPLK